MVNEHKTALIESDIVLSSYNLQKKPAHVSYSTKNFYYKGKLNFKIAYIRRKDKIEDFCLKTAYSQLIIPDVCICK